MNNGRGPVDFAASNGARDKTLIEFKLASNKKLEHGLTKQLEVYLAANNTHKKIVIIVYYSEKEEKRVFDILLRLNLIDKENVVTIDARQDNKPSASIA